MKKAAALSFAAVLLFLGGAHAAPQTPPKASIQGVVLSAGTDRPIAGARLTLMRTGQTLPGRQNAAPSASTQELTGILITSGNEGRFEFRDLDPGRYKLTVTGNGYVRRDVVRETYPIVLEPGQVVQDVVIRLIPAANLTGYVQTPSGRPIPGVTVQALRRTFDASGNSRLQPAESVRTNDRGEYRLFWLTPGRYYVAAGSGPNVLMANADIGIMFYDTGPGNNVLPQPYPQVFFPSDATAETATLLDLQPGVELRGINMVLGTARNYRIRGNIIDPRTGRPPAKVRIAIIGGGSRYVDFDPSTGAFELAGLVPGTYSLRVFEDTGNPLGMVTGTEPILASTPIVITDSDIENVLPDWHEATTITGQIRVEGELPAATDFQRLRVQLRNSGPAFQTAVGADGTFVFNRVPDAELRTVLSGLPEGFYLKQARLDNRDVLGAPTQFSGGKTLEILISSGGGQIEGIVVDELNRPMPDVELVVVPDTNRERPELFKAVRTNSEGRFRVSGIAPGDYKLFSWQESEPYAYFDTELLTRFDHLGQPIRVEENSKQSATVRSIAVGAAR